jgi:hypothetical protein
MVNNCEHKQLHTSLITKIPKRGNTDPSTVYHHSAFQAVFLRGLQGVMMSLCLPGLSTVVLPTLWQFGNITSDLCSSSFLCQHAPHQFSIWLRLTSRKLFHISEASLSLADLLSTYSHKDVSYIFYIMHYNPVYMILSWWVFLLLRGTF